MKRTPVAYIAVEILITIPNLLSKRFSFLFLLKKTQKQKQSDKTVCGTDRKLPVPRRFYPV